MWMAHEEPGSGTLTGDALFAASMMWRATGEAEWRERAAQIADTFTDLAFPLDGPYYGLVRRCPGVDEVAQRGYMEHHGFIGLAELLADLSDHPHAARWKAVNDAAAKRAIAGSMRNNWRLVPSLYNTTKVGGGRAWNGCFYRYFVHLTGGPGLELRVGANAEILKQAHVLRRYAKTNQRRDALLVADRQVDWIMGANPFDATQAEGIGYNMPRRMMALGPTIPQIPGGVVTGIVGDEDDCGVSPPAAWMVAQEYDLPAVSMLVWAIADMMAEQADS